MEIEELKSKYFACYCNETGMRDMGIENWTEACRQIELNGINWTKEFQEITEKKMLEERSAFEFNSSWLAYHSSCKSYDDLYHLAEIFYKVILNDLLYDNQMFISSYEAFFNPYLLALGMETPLFEHYKLEDNNRYNELIKMTKVILSKDHFHSNSYKTVSELIGFESISYDDSFYL